MIFLREQQKAILDAGFNYVLLWPAWGVDDEFRKIKGDYFHSGTYYTIVGNIHVPNGVRLIKDGFIVSLVPRNTWEELLNDMVEYNMGLG